MAPRRGSVSLLVTAFATAAVLLRVGLVVAVAMAFFLVAFLGYFVLPFIFALLAFGILGISSTLRQYVRVRTRRRK